MTTHSIDAGELELIAIESTTVAKDKYLVLLVDDLPKVVDVTGTLLSRKGYSVLGFTNSAIAQIYVTALSGDQKAKDKLASAFNSKTIIGKPFTAINQFQSGDTNAYLFAREQQNWEQLMSYQIAVVVSDAMMPQPNGFELLGHVGETFPNTYRILLSGETEYVKSTQLKESLKGVAFDEYIEKAAQGIAYANPLQEKILFGLKRYEHRLNPQ